MIRPDSDIHHCRVAHEHLLAHLTGTVTGAGGGAHAGPLTDGQAREPSWLPGWTVGHVLTHLARNADSHVRMVEGALRGEVAHQYPGGREQRAADIEAGAGRPAADLVEDVRASAERLELAWDALADEHWRGSARSGPEVVPAAVLPFRRWREVEVHHADLGLGFGVDDWSDAYVERELRTTASELGERLRPGTLLYLEATDTGWSTTVPDPGDPGAVVTAPARRLLAWLLGRVQLPDTPPLAAWQREHRSPADATTPPTPPEAASADPTEPLGP